MTDQISDQAAPQNEVLGAVREVLENPLETHPQPQTSYFPFPASRKVVTNFKTWVFLIEAEPHKEFAERVRVFLCNLGYKAKERQLSFSPGLIVGVSRSFIEVPLYKAEGSVYGKSFGGLLYVSLRVAYKPSISLLKLALFIIFCAIPPLLEMENFLGSESYSYFTWCFSESCEIAGDVVSSVFGNAYSPRLWALRGTVNNILVLGVALSIISFIRGQGFLGWLYANYDELYRDDMATIWNMSELAIISTADEMDLKQVPVGEEFSQNSLQQTQLPKRRPRF